MFSSSPFRVTRPTSSSFSFTKSRINALYFFSSFESKSKKILRLLTIERIIVHTAAEFSCLNFKTSGINDAEDASSVFEIKSRSIRSLSFSSKFKSSNLSSLSLNSSSDRFKM